MVREKLQKVREKSEKSQVIYFARSCGNPELLVGIVLSLFGQHGRLCSRPITGYSGYFTWPPAPGCLRAMEDGPSGGV